jgi:hypothetical protein
MLQAMLMAELKWSGILGGAEERRRLESSSHGLWMQKEVAD